MKIIEKGNGEDWKLQIRCKCISDKYGLEWDGDKEHCNSLLEIDKNDVESKHWEKYLMGLEGIDYIVTCLVCGCKIYLDEKQLPDWVKKIADDKSKDKKIANNKSKDEEMEVL